MKLVELSDVSMIWSLCFASIQYGCQHDCSLVYFNLCVHMWFCVSVYISILDFTEINSSITIMPRYSDFSTLKKAATCNLYCYSTHCIPAMPPNMHHHANSSGNQSLYLRYNHFTVLKMASCRHLVKFLTQLNNIAIFRFS